MRPLYRLPYSQGSCLVPAVAGFVGPMHVPPAATVGSRCHQPDPSDRGCLRARVGLPIPRPGPGRHRRSRRWPSHGDPAGSGPS